ELARLVGAAISPAAAVSEQNLEPVAPDREGSITPDAQGRLFLREREPPPVKDERVRPGVHQRECALVNSGGPQVGGRTSKPPDAIERPRLPGQPRSISAARCGLRGNSVAHRLDLLDVVPCLPVVLKLAVDGLDGPAERGYVCRAGGEKAHPPAAQNRGVGPLIVTHDLHLGSKVAGDRLPEDAPFRRRERGPCLAASEQDQRPWPQADIGGQVLPCLIVLELLDLADLLLDPGQPSGGPLGPER